MSIGSIFLLRLGVSVKVPMLNVQGVCWKDAVREGSEGGNVDSSALVVGVNFASSS